MNKTTNNFDLLTEDAHIDLTPLIDVIFMLIIFFIMTMAFSKPVLDIALPQSTTSQTKKNLKQLNIHISNSGEYLHKNKRISLEELSVMLDDKEYELRVFADKSCPLQALVGIIDLAKIKRDGRFSLATDHHEK